MMYKYKILKKKQTVRQKMILRKFSEDSEGCVSLMIDYNHQKEYCNDVVKLNRFFHLYTKRKQFKTCCYLIELSAQESGRTSYNLADENIGKYAKLSLDF